MRLTSQASLELRKTVKKSKLDIIILHVDLNQKNLSRLWANDELTSEIELNDFASAKELDKLSSNEEYITSLKLITTLAFLAIELDGSAHQFVLCDGSINQ